MIVLTARKRSFISVVLVATLAVSCSTGSSDSVFGSEDSAAAGERHPAANNPHPRVARPVDRDPKAVAASLAAIDACKMLSLKWAVPSGDTVTIPSGPHSCYLADKADTFDELIQVDVGVGFMHEERHRAEPRALEGVKVYLQREDNGTGDIACEMNVPISFTRSIRYLYNGEAGGDTCFTVADNAREAVGKLASDPSSLTAEAERGPLAEWDMCDLFASVLGGQSETFVYKPYAKLDSGSSCTAVPAAESGESLVDDYLTSAIDAHVSYDRWDPEKQTTKISGKDSTASSGGGCEVKWNNGSSGVQEEWHDSVVFSLKSKKRGCDELKKIAEGFIEASQSTASKSEIGAQNPLTYKFEEHDSLQPGACLHFALSDSDCEPYHEVAVPRGGLAAIVEASERDRNVLCAAAAAAVAKHYGAHLQPATYDNACFFLDPGHTFELVISRWNDPARRVKGCDSGYDVDVAGQPGYACMKIERNMLSIYISTRGDASQPGALVVNAVLQPPRGSADNDPPPDSRKQGVAKEVAADIVRQHG